MSAEVAVNVPAAILFAVVALVAGLVAMVWIARGKRGPSRGHARARFKVGVYLERDRKAEELEPWDAEDTLELPPTEP